jgi:hypothetical protein
MWPGMREVLGLTEYQIAVGSFGLIIVSRLIMAPYWAYREAADLLPAGGSLRPDMRINDAIDYLVNYSTVKLKQPDPPTILEYGPAKGSPLRQKGVEHEDARRLINNEFISGNLRCWGRRQILTRILFQFEESIREIKLDYWHSMRIHPFACLYNTESSSQTEALPGVTSQPLYTELMVSRAQIQRIWRQKSIGRQLIGKIKGQQRIRP